MSRALICDGCDVVSTVDDLSEDSDWYRLTWEQDEEVDGDVISTFKTADFCSKDCLNAWSEFSSLLKM